MTLHTSFNRFHRNHNGLADRRAASIFKPIYGSAAYFCIDLYDENLCSVYFYIL